ncbi:hypothetical protein LXL04_029981 [Taraxacum kok-saghyz]
MHSEDPPHSSRSTLKNLTAGDSYYVAEVSAICSGQCSDVCNLQPPEVFTSNRYRIHPEMQSNDSSNQKTNNQKKLRMNEIAENQKKRESERLLLLQRNRQLHPTIQSVHKLIPFEQGRFNQANYDSSRGDSIKPWNRSDLGLPSLPIIQLPTKKKPPSQLESDELELELKKNLRQDVGLKSRKSNMIVVSDDTGLE